MLLRNFWEWFRAITNETYFQSSGNNLYGILTSIKYKEWTEGNDKPYLYGMHIPLSAISNAYSYNTLMPMTIRPLHVDNVSIGTGTTPVSAEDYKLDNEITLSNKTFSATMSVSAEGKVTMIIIVSATNTGSEDVTITEIGLEHKFGLLNASSVAYNSISTIGTSTVLIARHILETPVTIAPGDTGSVNINLTLF